MFASGVTRDTGSPQRARPHGPMAQSHSRASMRTPEGGEGDHQEGTITAPLSLSAQNFITPPRPSPPFPTRQAPASGRARKPTARCLLPTPPPAPSTSRTMAVHRLLTDGVQTRCRRAAPAPQCPQSTTAPGAATAGGLASSLLAPAPSPLGAPRSLALLLPSAPRAPPRPLLPLGSPSSPLSSRPPVPTAPALAAGAGRGGARRSSGPPRLALRQTPLVRGTCATQPP